jgi:hypothetical protein
MKISKFTLAKIFLIFIVTSVCMIACQKEVTIKKDKTQMYNSFKQNMLKQFELYSDSYLETSKKHFGTAHNGKVNLAEFESDLRVSYSKSKNPSPKYDAETQTKLNGLKPWNPKEETLDSYFAKNNTSPELAKYVVRMKNYIESAATESLNEEVFDLDISLDKFVNKINNGISNIELDAISDNNLSESDVLSILAATSGVQGLSKTIIVSSQMFFKNLSNSLTKKLQTRCWLCSLFRTVVNIWTTVIVSVATYAWNAWPLPYRLASNILNGDGWSGIYDTLQNQAIEIDNLIYGTTGWIDGNYNCYLPADLWKC